jgi:dihydropyrimidine dehydrogenase (NAD+) subunit PreA
LCYVACTDTAHQCIDLIAASGETVAPNSWDASSNGKYEAIHSRPQPRVREDDCVGCRLCFNVCPVEGCIEMVELPSGRESVTWDELCRAQPEVTEDWDAMKRYRDERGIHIH